MGQDFPQPQWNATAKMLVCVTAFLLVWECVVIYRRWTELTISYTLRSWGPWAGLAIMVLFTVLWWHIFVQRMSDWP